MQERGNAGAGSRIDYRRSSRTIGWQVAAVSAVLIMFGAALVVAYLFWQTRPAEQRGLQDPGSIRVFLDPSDILLAGVVVALCTIMCAGGAGWIIARRAVRPLAEAARVQQRFVADASHELRTPLAVLNARIQQLEIVTPTDDPRREVVAALREDARIMSVIIDDMLATAAGAPAQGGTSELAAVMTSAVADLAVLGQGREVLVTPVPLDVRVALPVSDLRRCIVALLDNAIDHTPPGGVVSISAVARGSFVHVTVTDEGDGIVGIEPARVFDRFAHGASISRGEDTVGRTRVGIGLSLVKELVERHGGGVRVVRTGPTGTEFALTLPLAFEPVGSGTSWPTTSADQAGSR
ncbi:HAMP domain-containing sensor histidine kinase [Microbacterium sp. 13-71-7]|jgi:signal transduction histidine kinase|uniref:sensor histidine kinase n=1 Tax=Microbacterium sp. 13-71-7 TaxID=1970399 RepID=UPI000BD63F80|nr:HAMP domain-containing sensor histidine kinase [Microbacterium sp. 13-71-7]OZB81114.1 MAG: hypothetical protein B7X32_17710 [Microbacterium sp. 13-71-7]